MVKIAIVALTGNRLWVSHYFSTCDADSCVIRPLQPCDAQSLKPPNKHLLPLTNILMLTCYFDLMYLNVSIKCEINLQPIIFDSLLMFVKIGIS